MVRGNGNSGLLSGLTPAVSSLTLSGVPLAHVTAVARMSEGSREPPVVGTREEGPGRKDRSPNEKGGGAAVAVVDTVALGERTGRSPGESPEVVRSGQMVPTAPQGQPVVYQPAVAPVVYNAAGGQQSSQAAGMSQQSMCAGVPPTGMAPQYGNAVADPRMVTGVIVAEGMNPWSAAQRVDAMMSSPQTPVRELTYPTSSRDLADLAAAREKEKLEDLKNQIAKQAEEALARGKAAIQQDMENWVALKEESRELDRKQVIDGGHKSTHSSGGSYHTASPEQKNIEWRQPNGPAEGVTMQLPGQDGQDHLSHSVQPHLQGQDHHLMSGSVPPPPRDQYDPQPRDGYMNRGMYNQNPGNPMGFPCQGATGNTRYFFIGDQQGHNVNPQAQDGGAPAGQGHQPRGGFGFPGGNTGPMDRYGWIGGQPQGHQGNPGQAPGGHQGNPGQAPGPPGGYPGNPGPVPPQQQLMPPAAPRVLGEVQTETLRTVELPKLDRNATAIGFGDWLTVVRPMIWDVSYTSAQWWEMIMTSVDQAYQQWIRADPLTRLRMAPIVPDAARGWPRTETRVMNMLLQALPTDIQEDLVSTRRMSTDQIMFKLYTIFQPGGQTERTSLLQLLVDWKSPSNNAAEVAASIRKWKRWAVRAEELHLVLPDPLIMAGVVARMSDTLAKIGGAQTGYRLSMARQQLGIDLRPDMPEIQTFSELLQAEAEELSLRQGGTTPSPQPKATGVVGVKSMSGPEPSSDPPKGGSKGKTEGTGAPSNGKRGEKPDMPINAANVVHKTPCMHWLTDKGCQYADKCRFTHTVLDYKDGRCFNCSGKGHSRRECPAGKRSESRNTRDEKEEPKVKTTRVRPRSRGRPESTGKGAGDGQEKPEPMKKADPTKESTVTITPVAEEASQVVGDVNQC